MLNAMVMFNAHFMLNASLMLNARFMLSHGLKNLSLSTEIRSKEQAF